MRRTSRDGNQRIHHRRIFGSRRYGAGDALELRRDESLVPFRWEGRRLLRSVLGDDEMLRVVARPLSSAQTAEAGVFPA